MNRPFPLVSATFWTVLVCLLAIDLSLIGVNIVGFLLQKAGIISIVPEYLRITEDRALPESFNYLKWAVIVVALAWISLRDRWLPAALWALVFAMILIDDSFQLHESLGDQISVDLDLHNAFFLFGNDLGEILVFLIMAAVAMVLTAVLLFRSSPATGKISVRYYGVLVALGFFGVGIDAIHQAIAHMLESQGSGTLLASVFALIEDGGEMLVASYAVALTLAPPAHSILDRLVLRAATSGSSSGPGRG